MILVLGYFGYKTNKLDGQTIKTRDLFSLLNEIADEEVELFDTEEFKYNKLTLFSLLVKIARCRTLCYLPAYGNLRILFPIVYCLSILFRVNVHYFVVGGWLKEFLEHLPLHRRMLSRISGIHVETRKLKRKLEEAYHFENVDIFPNFRRFSFEPEKIDVSRESRVSEKECLRLVFVSRIEQSKGLDTLVDVVDILIAKGFSDRISVDFYGQKRDGYYDDNLLGYKMFNYKGVLQPEEVIAALRTYDVLIFPTHYAGEGCPGILVEALSAGLPIIASDWKYNDEFVENGVNGFLCDVYVAEAYAEAILTLLKHPAMRNDMSRNSYMKSQDFSIEKSKSLLKGILGLQNLDKS